MTDMQAAEVYLLSESTRNARVVLLQKENTLELAVIAHETANLNYIAAKARLAFVVQGITA